MLGRRRLELVSRGEEGAVGERSDHDRGYGDAAEEHIEDHYLEAHGLEWVSSGDDHADHRPWQEDDPRGLGGVYEGNEGALKRCPQDGCDGLAARP